MRPYFCPSPAEEKELYLLACALSAASALLYVSRDLPGPDPGKEKKQTLKECPAGCSSSVYLSARVLGAQCKLSWFYERSVSTVSVGYVLGPVDAGSVDKRETCHTEQRVIVSKKGGGKNIFFRKTLTHRASPR